MGRNPWYSVQHIKVRRPVSNNEGDEKAGARPGPFICSFTAKYARYSLAQLRDLDRRMRADVFPSAVQGDEALPDPSDVEQWFWHGLGSEADARILYCSDIDGTAFPNVGRYSAHAWSPQQLAEAPRSLLRFVDYSIPGVNTPMLYFGMRASHGRPTRAPLLLGAHC